jgi:hypothetical protein
MLASTQQHTALSESRLQSLELQQQLHPDVIGANGELGDYYDTPEAGAARAGFITGSIIPSLEKERRQIRKQIKVAKAAGKTSLVEDLKLALNETTNKILQAQLEAQEATAVNTEEAAETLAEFGGSLSFQFGGQQFTDYIGLGLGV